MSQTKSRQAWEKRLKILDKLIFELIEECEKSGETERGGFFKIREELKNIGRRDDKIKSLMKPMGEKGLKSTEPTPKPLILKLVKAVTVEDALFLPPYSHEFNPIEHCWFAAKSLFKKIYAQRQRRILSGLS